MRNGVGKICRMEQGTILTLHIKYTRYIVYIIENKIDRKCIQIMVLASTLLRCLPKDLESSY